MPWLSGFSAVAASDAGSPAASAQIARLADDDGGDGALAVAYGGGSLVASYRAGVFVTAGTDRVLARAPGFVPNGSADDLVALAVGDAGIGERVVALAITAGGHRERTTSLVLYSVGRGRRLEPVFAAPVEDHAGSETWKGSIALFAGGLVYRAPRSDLRTVWMFDALRGRYVERATGRQRSPAIE